MNSPVNIKQTREQLLQRLSTRRPLYEAIRENLPKSRALHIEMLEPRVLLSADLVAGVDHAFTTANFDATEDLLESFANDELLNSEIPIVAIPVEDSDPAEIEAANFKDLTTVDTELFPDLANLDTNTDERISLVEFFNEAILDKIDDVDVQGLSETDFAAAIQGLATLDDPESATDWVDLVAALGTEGYDLSFSEFSVTADEGSIGDDGSVRLILDASLSLTKGRDLDLGPIFDDFGVVFDGVDEATGINVDLTAPVTTTMSFDLVLGAENFTPAVVEGGVETAAASADYYVELEAASIVTSLSKGWNDAQDVRIGFLGVDATGSIGLTATAAFAKVPGAATKLIDSNPDTTAPGWDAFDSGTVSGAVDAGSYVSLSVDPLPSAPNEVFFGFDEPLILKLTDATPLDITGLTKDEESNRFPLNFVTTQDVLAADLQSFTRLDPTTFIAAFSQVADSIEGISENDTVSGFEIPFTSTTVGDVFDFATTIKNTFLYDDAEGADNNNKLTDETGQASYSTIQGLTEKLAGLLSDNTGFELDKGSDGEIELTLDLDFSETVTAFDVPLAFNFDIADIADVGIESGDLSLSGTGTAGLTLGISLGKTLPGQSKLLEGTDALPNGIDENGEEKTQVELQSAQVDAITGTPINPVFVDPVVPDDITFTLGVQGVIGGNIEPITITIPAQEMVNGREVPPNTKLSQLVDDINAALNAGEEDVGVSAYVVAERTNDWFKLTLTGPLAETAKDFSILVTPGSLAETFLGLSTTEAVEVIEATNPGSSAALTKHLAILYGGDRYEIDLDEIDLAYNSNILNLVNDLNKAIETEAKFEGLKGKVEVSSSGNRLIIAKVSAGDSNSLAVEDNERLGFINATASGIPVEANTDDFIINTSDGFSYAIDVQGLVDIDALSDAIFEGTDEKVSLEIDPDSSDRLVLKQIEVGLDGTEKSDRKDLKRFSVSLTNGSKAALQLGITGIDGTIVETDESTVIDKIYKVAGGNGTIVGSVIAGPTLAERLFLEDVFVEADLTLEASNVEAFASFGFVDVTLSGDGDLSAGVKATLINPKIDDVNSPERFTLAQIGEFFFPSIDNDDPEDTGAFASDLVLLEVDTPSGAINLQLGVDAAGLPEGLTGDLTAPVTIELNPTGDESLYDIDVTTSFSGLAIKDFSDIGFSEILDGIVIAAGLLSDLEGFEFLQEPIPLVGASVTDFISIADRLDAAVSGSEENQAGSLQDLELALKAAFGIDPASDQVQLSLVDVEGDNALRIDLELELGFSEDLGIDFDLISYIPELQALLGDSASLAGAADIGADGMLTLSLAFGVGLIKDENLYEVYVFGGEDTDGNYDTGLNGSFALSGNDISFRGALGPAGIFVKDGEVDATIVVGVGLVGDDLKNYYTAGDPITASLFEGGLTPSLDANFDVSFPTESSPSKNIAIEVSEDTGYVPDVTLEAGFTDGLLGFDFANQGLLDNILLAVDGVDLFLAGLQDALDGEIGGLTLPLVGDKLADGAQFIQDFRADFIEGFREGINGFADPDQPSIVVTLLEDLFYQLQIGVEVTEKLEDTGDNPYIEWQVVLADDYMLDAGIDLDLGIPGLGLETTGAVELDVDWVLDLTFGLSQKEGAYLDLAGDELTLGIDARLADGTSVAGTLGFLQFTASEGTDNIEKTGLSTTFAVDVKNGRNLGQDRAGFSDLGGLDFEVKLAADALIDLDLELKVDGADALPQINANFLTEWTLPAETLADGTSVTIDDVSVEDGIVTRPGPIDATKIQGISGDSISAGLQKVGFYDVEIDAGSFFSEFLSPVLSEVQKVTGPIEDVVDFITAPLPVISDLGPSTSLLDIAEAILPQQVGFVRSIDNLLSVINGIPTDADSLVIPFGDFEILGAPVADPDNFDLGQAVSEAQTAAAAEEAKAKNDDQPTTPDIPASGTNQNKAKDFVNTLKSNGTISFPFLSSPTEVFGLLSGGDVDLFEFTLEPLGVDFTYSQFFPIIGPLGASITGSFSAIAKLAFGFDTSGINQFADSGFSDPGLIFNGLYLNDYYDTESTDVPELELDLSLVAAAELNLGVAKGGVSGGVYGSIDFNLNDPNLDGKVRIEELLGNIVAQANAEGLEKLLTPLAIFDVSGEVYAQLKAFLEVDVLLFSISYNEDITPRIPIFEFDLEFDRPLQLGTTYAGSQGETLQLSVGELSDLRLNGDLSDGAERVVVTQGSNGLTVTLSDAPSAAPAIAARSLGAPDFFTPAYDVPEVMVIKLGDGDDYLDLSGITSNIIFHIDGGAGNDTIILGGGAGSKSYVTGGTGNDLIIGSPGADVLIGGQGDDTIFGEGGSDIISGDELEILSNKGDVDFLDPESFNTLRARIGAVDGADIISGGTGADTVFGAGGGDMLHGDAMWAGSRVIDADNKGALIADNATRFSTLTERDETLDDGADLIFGDGGFVDLSDDSVASQQPNDGLVDIIRGGGDADIIYGGKGNDDIAGGGGNDDLYGELGYDTIRGNSGEDLIVGAEGRDQLFGDDDNDSIYGGDGQDYIEGGDNDDILFGGLGADKILGNEGDDHLRGGGDSDELFGGANNDYLDGDFGDDILFGDTDGRPGVTLNAEDFGDDELVSTYGTDILDGEGGSDQYVVNYTGGTADRLVTTFDSGRASTGPDSLTINGSVTVSYDETGVERSEVFLQGTEVDDEEFEGWGDEPSEVAEPTVREAGDDIYLLRANPNRADGLAFVAILNKDVNPDPDSPQDEYPIERVDYTVSMETLVINSGDGNDYFALDDNRAATTINGGSGEDIFQIGQMFNLPRTNDVEAGNIQDHPNPTDPDYPDGQDYNEGETDVFATIETTRGFLSNGITEATTINGGDDNDAFVVFHNKAVLTVNGDDGNDEFTVRAFALSGSQETIQERTDISGGTDADLVQYAVNAPVSIDGGKGEDTVRVIGTEFGDDFIVAKEGIFGVGINVNYVNVETLVVDGGAGDDRFFIQGTSADTTVVGGLGSDSFNVAGDPPPIISNDLLGHSGTISHTIETDDATYKEVRVRDVVANVADNNEPAIVITPQVELPAVAQDALGTFAMYSVVLTQAPKDDERVIVTAVAPRVTTEERDDKGKKKVLPLIQFVDGEQRSDSIQVVFDKDNWNVAQNISFAANGDFDLSDDEDGSRLGNLVHSIKTERISLDYEIEGMVTSQSNLPALAQVDTSDDLPNDDSLNGGTIEITSGTGVNQVREISSYTDEGELTLVTAWNTIPDETSEIVIRAPDSTIYTTGDIEDASNNTTIATDVTFVRDLSGGKVVITEGAGIDQERLIVASAGNELTLVKPWDTALDDTSKFLISPDPVEFVISGKVKDSSNQSPIITLENLSDTLPSDGSLIGGTIKIIDGDGEGQERGIGGYDAENSKIVLELITSWNIEPDGSNDKVDADGNKLPSTFEIRLVGGKIITGEIVDGENRTTINTPPGKLPNSEGGPEGGALRGATVEIIKGTGIGQERLIMQSTDEQLTLNKPWETPLDDTSVYQIQSYSAVKAPALEVRLDLTAPEADTSSGAGEELVVPEVIIIESNGSTNVIESADPTEIDPGDLVNDYYDVKLSTPPAEGEVVKVFIQPEETITTRGQVFYKENQVTVGGEFLIPEVDEEGAETGRQYLEFDLANWYKPQQVKVSAIDDNVVDGGDTKVFPSIPRVLSDFEGTLTLDGEGDSDLAIGSLGDPLMLPGEKNIPPAAGQLVGSDSLTSAVIDQEGLGEAMRLLGVSDRFVLISQQYTFEITDGPGRGQAAIVEDISAIVGTDQYLITFNERTQWDAADRPTSDSSFTFSTTNPNLLVNEYEREDVVTIFNNESISNDSGELSAKFNDSDELIAHNFSLTLGGADEIVAGEPSVDIDYLNMENFTVNLGGGDDELLVSATHTRQGPFESEDPLKDEYQTVTFINAGSGNDKILITDINSFLAVKGERGDDTIDASESTTDIALIAFGDEGQDTLRGGAANDILFGDLGRIDYFDIETDVTSQLITRVGLEHDFDNMLSKPESGNLEQVPSDQTDGTEREATLIVARNPAVGDTDYIYGNGGDDIIIAGTGADEVDGGSESDLILGDNARITLLDKGGNLSELNKSLADGATRLYKDNGGATPAELEPNVQRLEPDPENLGTFDRLDLIFMNHKANTEEVLFGNDLLVGQGGDDFIFGQLGNDNIKGKGGDDYVEGNGGNDTIRGDWGQDVLIGGSSDLFGLNENSRIDGSDLIYGGSGNKTDYNDVTDGRNTNDSDLILGDNARVATLPDQEYSYDQQLKVRAYTLLDYLPGVDNSEAGLGGADELHGELGNDTIHGMIGNDVLFGESQDDNLIGGVGYDRIYGGSGVDGILGDDGLIQVSKNGTAEPLNGVDEATSQQVIRTKGKFVGAVVNPNGEIHKAAELHAWDVGSNDVIYGGLGDDFIHGGSGDDAISGAEALEIHYHNQPQDPSDDTPVAEYRIVGGSYSYNPANPLEYNEVDQKLEEFIAEDPRPLITDFLLNFEQDAGTVIDGDGIDRIFGDMGNDWIVGGTGADRMFGGLGDDLINADDNLTTPGVDDNEYNYGDFAYGGGGLDVLIANTGRDRLFDWNGEYNSFYVPFSRFGAPTVNRKISPDTVEFIEQLGEFSGADMNLGEDSSFFDELGLVDNADELTKEQKGSPRDPQPGNMKGKFDDSGEPEELENNLMAAELPEEYSTEVVIIDDLRAVGQAAVQRWLASGLLNEAQLTQLSGMSLQIADLGGLKLALASSDGKTIYIDSNAAGYGWFVDATGMQDEEFVAGKSVTEGASAKMDLLSVVMHEIGHQLGLGHGDNGLMHESLDAGVRSAGLLASGSVYTFDDDSGLATAQSAELDGGWVEMAVASLSSDSAEEQGAQVDWNDSF
ncbi:MAG: LEPR-XLL domain-containing protein [Halioglobus sp.]